MPKYRFARNIKFLRRIKGWTQGVLAEKLDISRNKVSNFESGFVEPNLDSLIRVSKLFDVTIDQLINGRLDLKREGVDIIRSKSRKKLSKDLEVDIQNFIYATQKSQKILDGYEAFFSLNEQNGMDNNPIIKKFILVLEHMLENNWELLKMLKEDIPELRKIKRK